MRCSARADCQGGRGPRDEIERLEPGEFVSDWRVRRSEGRTNQIRALLFRRALIRGYAMRLTKRLGISLAAALLVAMSVGSGAAFAADDVTHGIGFTKG